MPGIDGLTEEGERGQLLMHEYNHLKVTDYDRKEEILNQLLGKKGANTLIRPPFYLDFESNISVGENFKANYNFTVLDIAPVTIGDDVYIGPNTSLYAVNHPLHPKTRANRYEKGRPITIEDKVWLGGSVTWLLAV